MMQQSIHDADLPYVIFKSGLPKVMKENHRAALTDKFRKKLGTKAKKVSLEE